MQISLRAPFLIVAASLIFHLSLWQVGVLLVGYGVCEYFDQWWAKRAKDKVKDEVFDDEIYGWESDADDLDYENKGALTRMKLVGRQRIIVTRVAEILRRMP